jgi:hypothetical protein
MTKTMRDSRFEWMRIVCMLLIIAYHYSLHAVSGGFSAAIGSSLLYRGLSVLLFSWSRLGVYGFVAITSYFMLKKPSFHLKRILYIYLQTLFYCVICAAVYVVLRKTAGNGISFSFLFEELTTPMSKQYWFITTYLFFYIISPLLVAAVSALSAKQLKSLCLVTGAMLLVFSNMGGELISFIYVFLLVAAVQKGEFRIFEKRTKSCFALFVAAVIALYCLTKFSAELHIPSSAVLYLEKVAAFFMMIGAVLMLYLFAQSKIKPNSAVNYIAKTTFGIYVLHENLLMYSPDVLSDKSALLWDALLGAPRFAGSHLLLAHIIIATVVVFIAGFLADALRLTVLENGILNKWKWLDSVTQRFDRWYTDKLDFNKKDA